jgi:hypothetical protein
VRGREDFRDIHLGAALHYAQTRIDLGDKVIVGFNATSTPTIQELPVSQMVAALAFKLFGTSWWGWANIVSLALFFESPVPAFSNRADVPRRTPRLVDADFFLAEPLVFVNSGAAATDGFYLVVTIWFLYFGVKLVSEPGLKWGAPACAFGSLAAVSKLPFFMTAGLALFLLVLWQHGFCFKRIFFLAVAGGVSGGLFLIWTHYTDAL